MKQAFLDIPGLETKKPKKRFVPKPKVEYKARPKAESMMIVFWKGGKTKLHFGTTSEYFESILDDLDSKYDRSEPMFIQDYYERYNAGEFA